MKVETLFWTRTALTDVAFERDLVAWVGERSGDGCARVFTRSTASGTTKSLALSSHEIYGPVCEAERLALSGRRLMWVSVFGAHTTHSRVDTALVGEATHRTLVDHAIDFSGGSFVGKVAAAEGTFAFATGFVSETCTSEGECEADYEKVQGSVSVFRNGRLSAFRLKATAHFVAVAGDRVATVQPDVAADAIVLHTLAGRTARTLKTNGTVRGLALSDKWVAAVVADGRARRLQLIDRGTGRAAGEVELPTRADVFQLAVSGTHAVVASGRMLWAVDITRKRFSLVLERPYLPRGVSIEGRRVAWGERIGARGRVLSVTLER